jgi:YgiT-type zinc finger domain-containing protein
VIAAHDESIAAGWIAKASSTAPAAGVEPYAKACFRCLVGTRSQEESTRTLTGGGTIIVVRHVPTQLCDTCANEYFEALTERQLTRLLDDAVRLGIRVADLDYRRATAALGAIPVAEQI